MFVAGVERLRAPSLGTPLYLLDSVIITGSSVRVGPHSKETLIVSELRLALDPFDSVEEVSVGNHSLLLRRHPSGDVQLSVGTWEQAGGLRVLGSIRASAGIPGSSTPLLGSGFAFDVENDRSGMFLDPVEGELHLFVNGTSRLVAFPSSSQSPLLSALNLVGNVSIVGDGFLRVQDSVSILGPDLFLGVSGQQRALRAPPSDGGQLLILNPGNEFSQGVMIGGQQMHVRCNELTGHSQVTIGPVPFAGALRVLGSVRASTGTPTSHPSSPSTVGTGFAFDEFSDTGLFSLNCNFASLFPFPSFPTLFSPDPFQILL